ncbi:hypothetical protein [Pectobacterium brasiliense]|uniref:hypothetical protein n=1 Tax=Pectobacterium brasiliense TaxID=180957 RepID=UPI0019692C3F|nr:hypothetical protein [Pectobacterium brasiliense]MBN3055172.1 hypothetical protein [Pectobacterium brasiliense]
MNKTFIKSAIIFILAPIVLILISLVIFPSNFSEYHFNTHYIFVSLLASIFILGLYFERKSYKYLNDFLLGIATVITALSYIIDDFKTFIVFPSLELHEKSNFLFWLVMFKMVLFVDCALAKIFITFAEWIDSRRNEKVTPFLENIEKIINRIPFLRNKYSKSFSEYRQRKQITTKKNKVKKSTHKIAVKNKEVISLAIAK